jgi:hypothetical protein
MNYKLIFLILSLEYKTDQLSLDLTYNAGLMKIAYKHTQRESASQNSMNFWVQTVTIKMIWSKVGPRTAEFFVSTFSTRYEKEPFSKIDVFDTGIR